MSFLWEMNENPRWIPNEQGRRGPGRGSSMGENA